RPQDPTELIAPTLQPELDSPAAGERSSPACERIGDRTHDTFPLVPQFALANLGSADQTFALCEHGNMQFILSEYPIKPFDQCLGRSCNTMLFCKLQESGSHTMLMHRVHFVEIDHLAPRTEVEPGPLALRPLQRNQFACTGIGQCYCTRVAAPFSV